MKFPSRPQVGTVALNILFSAVLFLISGCQSARNAVYCIGEDLTDIIVADVSVSLGTDMGGHIMLTELIQVKGYSYEDLYRASIGPRQLGLWECEREGWALSLAESNHTKIKQNAVFTLMPKQSYARKASSKFGIKAVAMESIDEVGVGGHLFIIGGRLGIRPLEIVDLFASLFTLDPLKDNLTWQQRRAFRAAKKAAKKNAETAKEEDEKKKAEVERFLEDI